MAKTAERSGAEQPSPREVGRHLRQVRKQQGLSRSVVARSAGLTRRELAAYERGRLEVPESDLWCLAGSCGVDVSDLLPRREALHISPDLSTIGVGDTVRRLREPSEPDELLREYLSMIYELRNLAPGSPIPLRQTDLAALADALGGTPDNIEKRLMQVVGVSRDEAAHLRSMILPPLSLPSPVRDAPRDNPYTLLSSDDVSPAIEQFFATPGPADPFAALAPTPTPVGFAAEPTGWAAPAPGPVIPDVVPPDVGTPTPAAPFGLAPPTPPPPGPTGAAPNPFPGPESTAPSDPFAGPVDPQASAALRDPFAPPSAVDPLAPPPLPPDPFSVAPPEPAAWADPVPSEPGSPNGHGDGVVIDDPFAGPPPADRSSNGSGAFGDAVIDAIVVDDPLRRAAPDQADRPAPHEVDVDGRPDGRPIIRPADPIAWRATDDPVAATGTIPAAPRFERANAQWQVGGAFPATAMADDGTLALRPRRRPVGAHQPRPRRATASSTRTSTCGPDPGSGSCSAASVADDERITGYSFDMDPVAGGGGYLLRLWEGSRQHWRPLAHAPVTDPAMLFGHHVVRLTVRGDHLSALVDGDSVLELPALSRSTVELGREPCRGDRIGIQAWSTTEVTVESFRVANL